MCWSKEVLLLHEEMRRILALFDWHARWWAERQSLFMGLSHSEEEGIVAYASKQAHIRQSLQSTFEHLWRSSHELIQLGIGADSDILDLTGTVDVDLLQPPPEESLS